MIAHLGALGHNHPSFAPSTGRDGDVDVRFRISGVDSNNVSSLTSSTETVTELEEIVKERAQARKEATQFGGDSDTVVDNCPQPENGKTRDEVAETVGQEAT